MSGGRDWTTADIPDLTGRRALVTGAADATGRQTVLELARHGAEVLLADRDPATLEATIARVSEEVPGALLHPLALDVADLSSVRRAASQVEGPLHLLVHGARVAGAAYHRTADGLELHMATNHFGPFALTGLLLPRLVDSMDGRVVGVASQASRVTRTPPLDDPRSPHGRYRRWDAYAKSTLSTLMFVLELDRRAREHGLPLRALGAHPGYSPASGAGRGGDDRREPGRTSSILQAVVGVVGQPAELGALATLMAATADLPGSTYIGPDGVLQLRGHPRIVAPARLALDRDAQRRLWELSEEATGVRYLD